uniref:Uncharacterized protein n=1 Tax=Cacopsylla melanoneura TaxID=428564 RepID=A0A8D8SF11_9HEMI
MKATNQETSRCCEGIINLSPHAIFLFLILSYPSTLSLSLSLFNYFPVSIAQLSPLLFNFSPPLSVPLIFPFQSLYSLLFFSIFLLPLPLSLITFPISIIQSLYSLLSF